MGGDTASVALVVIVVRPVLILLLLLLLGIVGIVPPSPTLFVEEDSQKKAPREGCRYRRGHRPHRIQQVEAAAPRSPPISEHIGLVVLIVGRGQGVDEEEGRCMFSQSGVAAPDGGRAGGFVGGGGVGYLRYDIEMASSCGHEWGKVPKNMASRLESMVIRSRDGGFE
jgi:hypothetical protein